MTSHRNKQNYYKDLEHGDLETGTTSNVGYVRVAS